MAVICPNCETEMELRTSRFGKFYGCVNYPKCTMTHGAHQETGEPLGRPADEETRKARTAAHRAFDKIWQDGGMKRRHAYGWMAKAMALTPEQAHIGLFNIAQCEMLVLMVEQYLSQPKEDKKNEDAG